MEILSQVNLVSIFRHYFSSDFKNIFFNSRTLVSVVLIVSIISEAKHKRLTYDKNDKSVNRHPPTHTHTNHTPANQEMSPAYKWTHI